MISVNVVIPMAGLGTRFANVGYADPKPFIDVIGKPMIQHVVENLRIQNARYIVIMRKEHHDKYALAMEQILHGLNHEILTIDRTTEGQACTVLAAHRLIDNDTPLLIANSDQIIDIDINDLIADSKKRKLDGSILTFWSDHPKWSFAKVDGHGIVTQTVEKIPISEHATVGIYYFESGKDFVESTIDMMVAVDKVNNEYYACPVYNYGIKRGKRYGIFEITESEMHGTGTPDDLDKYLAILKER